MLQQHWPDFVSKGQHEVSQDRNRSAIRGFEGGGGRAQFVTIGLPTTSLIVFEKYYGKKNIYCNCDKYFED